MAPRRCFGAWFGSIVLAALIGCLGCGGADTTDAASKTSEFELFRIGTGGGECLDPEACSGLMELYADGRFRLNEFHVPRNAIREATVSAADLASAIEVVTDPALVALLQGPRPVCPPPTDFVEVMSLVQSGEIHLNSTTLCDGPPLVAARDRMEQLATAYFP